MAEESAGAKTETAGQQTEERPAAELLDRFVEDLEQLLDSEEETQGDLIGFVDRLPQLQNAAMVDFLEAMGMSEAATVQAKAIDKTYEALEAAVANAEFPHTELDRMRNILVDLMTSPHDEVSEQAITGFETRERDLAVRDVTTLGWLSLHVIRKQPVQIHGIGHYIREKEQGSPIAA
jgi:hypothetical protein